MTIKFTHFAAQPMALQPLPRADWVGDSAPLQQGCELTRVGRISSGLWSSDPGHFNWTYYVHEVIHIMEGEAMIREH
jgi:uncharacterized cupin superfamily protein